MNRAEALRKMLDPVMMVRVERSIIVTVARSFETEARRGEGIIKGEIRATQNEIKRRTGIAYDWFITLRTQYGYSSHRAMDSIPLALRAELDGTKWVPPVTDRGWAPAKV